MLTRAAISAVDWEGAYDAHAHQLLAYLTRLVHNTETARDLLQDTFVRAIRAERDLRDQERLPAWLYRIATNLAYRHLRRSRRLAFVPFVYAERIAVDGADSIALDVHAALNALAPEQAAALLLHYQQGFSRREIADICGIGEEGVKSRLARGRANFLAAYARLDRGRAR